MTYSPSGQSHLVMKNIRLFIVFSSLILTAWLSASYMTEVRMPANQDETATTPDNEAQNIASTALNEQSTLDGTVPVSYTPTRQK